jgi:hypothetical protein
MEHVLEILSLNEVGQPSMVCLNFQSLFRRSCWVANLQRFGEIEPDVGEEIEQASLSKKENTMTQALGKYVGQSGHRSANWTIEDEANTQKMHTLETQILLQESRMAETELASMISQSPLKQVDNHQSRGSEPFEGNQTAQSHRPVVDLKKSSDHAIGVISVSNTSPAKQEVDAPNMSRSASFVASFNKPSQPSVEVKSPSAGDIIFAREEAKLTAIQRAVETGTSAIPSLRQGDLLIKFNKGSSKNMERYVMLLDKSNILVWGSIEKLTSNLNLRDVLGISLGMGSSTLRRAYCAENHHTLPKLTNGTVNVKFRASC